VLLDEPLRSPLTDAPGSTIENSVKQIKYDNDEVILQVTSGKPGILVMSDLYTPDWRALIDGRLVKLYRANYTYRAVLVPAGQHAITFSYAPLSYKIGTVMTVCGIVVILMVCGLEIFRRRNAQKI